MKFRCFFISIKVKEEIFFVSHKNGKKTTTTYFTDDTVPVVIESVLEKLDFI